MNRYTIGRKPIINDCLNSKKSGIIIVTIIMKMVFLIFDF